MTAQDQQIFSVISHVAIARAKKTLKEPNVTRALVVHSTYSSPTHTAASLAFAMTKPIHVRHLGDSTPRLSLRGLSMGQITGY